MNHCFGCRGDHLAPSLHQTAPVRSTHLGWLDCWYRATVHLDLDLDLEIYLPTSRSTSGIVTARHSPHVQHSRITSHHFWHMYSTTLSHLISTAAWWKIDGQQATSSRSCSFGRVDWDDPISHIPYPISHLQRSGDVDLGPGSLLCVSSACIYSPSYGLHV